MLGQAHNIASAGLTDLETAARSVNGSIGNALDFANSTAVLNGNILKRGSVPDYLCFEPAVRRWQNPNQIRE